MTQTMQTQVDFYFNAVNLDYIAQRLIAKALAVNHDARVVVTADKLTLQAFDAYLWGFDAASFVPHLWLPSHHLPDNTEIADTPVLLMDNDINPSHINLLHDQALLNQALLINIGSSVPVGFNQFQRLLELVGVDEASKIKGRERFLLYKQQGYPMSHVDLAKK